MSPFFSGLFSITFLFLFSAISVYGIKALTILYFKNPKTTKKPNAKKPARPPVTKNSIIINQKDIDKIFMKKSS